jgi:hypothetical protein
MSTQEPKDIKTVYEEVCRSHDGIADFRYKLLAFLPIASGTGIFLLLHNGSADTQYLPLFLPAGVFGAVTTLGLFIYELRGIQTCHALLECAKELEAELLGRLSNFGPFTFKPKDLWGVIGTTGAALVIYPTVIGAWVFVAGIGLLNMLDESVIKSVLKVAAGFTIGLMLLGLVVRQLQEKGLEQKAGGKVSVRETSSTKDSHSRK